MTTKKHENFVGEPMGRKAVDKVPGIGPEHKKELERKGIHYAHQLLGEYLVCNMDKGKFGDYIMRIGANNKEKNGCFEAMKGWCDEHL
ncbi:predicted protein [Nematostella vectensis]|uniref:Barrier-to-autointegration factor 1 n=1 Tax=Nematostella vectensis TaxID=45351 RepID=A7SE29_NEMVE|nr:predicted protein [Nematostella vectensis]|eukprot:XP_001630099.1 predicted protein [Nematostella vectensis]